MFGSMDRLLRGWCEGVGESQGTGPVKWAGVRSGRFCALTWNTDTVSRGLTRTSCLSLVHSGKWVTKKIGLSDKIQDTKLRLNFR